jgi:hypothetical protein
VTGKAGYSVDLFYCGRLAMVEDLTRDLRQGGLPRNHMHSEHFASDSGHLLLEVMITTQASSHGGPSRRRITPLRALKHCLAGCSG